MQTCSGSQQRAPCWCWCCLACPAPPAVYSRHTPVISWHICMTANHCVGIPIWVAALMQLSSRSTGQDQSASLSVQVPVAEAIQHLSNCHPTAKAVVNISLSQLQSCTPCNAHIHVQIASHHDSKLEQQPDRRCASNVNTLNECSLLLPCGFCKGMPSLFSKRACMHFTRYVLKFTVAMVLA